MSKGLNHDNPIRFTLTDLFAKYQIDQLWVKNLSSIQYLSDFTGSTANLLVDSSGHKTILVDSRYTTQAKEECQVDEVLEIVNVLEDLSSQVKEQGCKKLGFEANQATFADHHSLAKNLPDLELVPIDENLANLRSIKTEMEIKKLKRANEIANQAFEELVDELHIGWTEKEAAWFLEKRFRECGGSALSFDTLVASGPRAAIVHGKASDRAFKEGDLIIIDRGLFANHYASDETNTFVLGKADSKQKDVYQIVKDAHDKCIEAVRPGIACKDLDAVARNHIHENGYGDYFGHGTGHGIGIEVHEMPAISPRGEGFLEEGMVFSIEPGIYIPDWGGIRIEDVVRVTGDACEILTLADKSRFELAI